jgi:hypothetical protein
MADGNLEVELRRVGRGRGGRWRGCTVLMAVSDRFVEDEVWLDLGMVGDWDSTVDCGWVRIGY